jgi:hypothetical protein
LRVLESIEMGAIAAEKRLSDLRLRLETPLPFWEVKTVVPLEYKERVEKYLLLVIVVS